MFLLTRGVVPPCLGSTQGCRRWCAKAPRDPPGIARRGVLLCPGAPKVVTSWGPLPCPGTHRGIAGGGGPACWGILTGVCCFARTSAVGRGWGWAEAPRDLPGVASWGLLPCPGTSWGSLEGVRQGAWGPTVGHRQRCAWAWRRQTSVSNPPWDPGHLGAPLPVTPWRSLGASAHPPPVNSSWSQFTAVDPSCQHLVGTRAQQRILASDPQRVSGSSSGPQMATSSGPLGTSSHPRQQPLVGFWARWHITAHNIWWAPGHLGTPPPATPGRLPGASAHNC